MIASVVCCLAALAIPSLGQVELPAGGTNRLRVPEHEKYFYNGLDRRIESGWTDSRSALVDVAYGAVLPPAQNLVEINFTAIDSMWRLESDQGYAANEDDLIVFRIRGEQEKTPLILFAGPAENVEPLRHNFTVLPQWHVVQVPLKGWDGENALRMIGLRSQAEKPSIVYVGYMYMLVSPVDPKKVKSKT